METESQPPALARLPAQGAPTSTPVGDGAAAGREAGRKGFTAGGSGLKRGLKTGLCWAAPLLVLVILGSGYRSSFVGALTAASEGGHDGYPGMGEVPTTIEAVQAVGVTPLGAVGTVLQFAVVLACPAMFVLMWLLQRHERRWQAEDGTSPAQKER
jgi:hypothetical protein